MSSKRLIFIELNEVNFDLVNEYVKKVKLPNLKRMLSDGLIETTSEKEYENLEPWIQWVSAHSGKSFKEHKVFRLGDIVNSDISQIFEEVERKGYSVGCISPMNAANKLNKPAYFLPDPWTLTNSDNSFWSKNITQVLQQVVNDNAQGKVSIKSLATLLLAICRYSRFKNYKEYIKLALSSFGKPWRKAMFLDLFINDIHWSLLKKKRPDFSTMFINAGAHIQHHYLFNAEPVKNKCSVVNPKWYIDSDSDPLLELLKLYDNIIGEYLDSDYDLVISTGLTQVPYTHEKYYWRIKEHRSFLTKIGVQFNDVQPRMTRDFLIEFSNCQAAKVAEKQLKAFVAVKDRVPLFKEIDIRENSLFVTLTYPHEVKSTFVVSNGDIDLDIANDLAFVAIKNGMHSPKGFFYSKGNVNIEALKLDSNVKNIHQVINTYFQ